MSRGERAFIKGNDAIGLAALECGLEFFVGYPITPASEIPEYLAEKYQADQIRIAEGKEPGYPGFVFMQAESEIAAINMVLGAAATGARAMTASSSPGMSLKMEGISYIHGSELPAVVVDVMRGGPGLGNIAPEQGDYFQLVKGGGHGNYRSIVLAPNSVQEMFDAVPRAFDLAFKYRMLVMIATESCLGQMQESVLLRDVEPSERYCVDSWAVDDRPDRERRLITSLRIEPEVLEQHVLALKAKYAAIEACESQAETYQVEDAELVLVAYGICSRIAKGAVNSLREQGVRVGLVRPKTLWPFPSQAIQETTDQVRAYLAVEMSIGQMVEDVKLAVNGKREVELYHRLGGVLPVEAELRERILSMRARYC